MNCPYPIFGVTAATEHHPQTQQTKKSPPRRGFSDRTNVICFGLAGTLEVQQSR